MNSLESSRLFIVGGASGVLGTLCYAAAVSAPLSQSGGYILVMAWPVLSIIFMFSLSRYLAAERASAANHLALLFIGLAFAMVAAMISIQGAVGIGIKEYIAESPEKEELLTLVRRSVRLVDLGLDVAWDIFIGTGLMFLSAALVRHSRFGFWWGIPLGLLGLLLVVLNVMTYPWPPDTRGLFDIGPIIALFLLALSLRLAFLGIQLQRGSGSAVPAG